MGAASHGVQASLSFALPLWAFSLQAGLLEGDRSALSLSAVLAAAVYAALAALLMRGSRARLQGEAFAWVAAGFVTVAVPLAFSAQQTAAVWALQGVGAMWLGLRQQRPMSRVFGWLLQFAAGCALLMHAVEALNDGRLEDSDYRIGFRFSLSLLAAGGRTPAHPGIQATPMHYSHTSATPMHPGIGMTPSREAITKTPGYDPAWSGMTPAHPGFGGG